jgi:hypothetical protein
VFAAALAMGLVGPAAGIVGGPALAATPASATINGTAPVQWDFAPVGGAAGDVDTFTLTVQLPQPAAAFYAPDVRTGSVHAAVLTLRMTWTGSDPGQALVMSATDPAAHSVGNDTLAAVNDGSDVNVLMIHDPLPGAYTITASNFNGSSAAAMPSHVVAHLQLVDLAGQPQPPQPPGARGFDNYHIPLDLMPPTLEEQQVLHGRAFGEPSIGVDPRNDKVMYQAGLYTIRATFDDSTSPPTPTWTDASDVPITSTASEDAILALDRATGRTIVSQLTLACSLSAVSDDDGTTWTASPKPCETPPAVDHQTIGAGPFAAPLPNGALYPDAVYYCSQNVATAECAVSLDGGLNYGAGVPMWTSSTCFGLHGHIKVAPNDGTAYVPNKACGSPECLIATSTAGSGCHPGFAVSTDNGASWTVHTLDESFMRLFNTGDPSIGIGKAGTMYFGFADRDGHPKIATCTNQGTTCTSAKDVGLDFNVQSTQMTSVVAGDDNRAAFAFLGSTTPGDDQAPEFVGTWHLYIAITTDGGHTWTTTDATPDHPVQRGCIEFNASCPSSRGSNDQRNLLDFNDITIDREGRVLAAYTDGCQPERARADKHGTCLADATRLSGLNPEIQGPALARQNCGPGLYAAFDPALPACPGTTATASPTPVVTVGTNPLPDTARAAPAPRAAWGAIGLVLVAMLAGFFSLRRRPGPS